MTSSWWRSDRSKRRKKANHETDTLKRFKSFKVMLVGETNWWVKSSNHTELTIGMVWWVIMSFLKVCKIKRNSSKSEIRWMPHEWKTNACPHDVLCKCRCMRISRTEWKNETLIDTMPSSNAVLTKHSWIKSDQRCKIKWTRSESTTISCLNSQSNKRTERSSVKWWLMRNGWWTYVTYMVTKWIHSQAMVISNTAIRHNKVMKAPWCKVRCELSEPWMRWDIGPKCQTLTMALG